MTNHESELRTAKDRLNAAAAKLLAGDSSAAVDAEDAQRELERIRARGRFQSIKESEAPK